MTLEQVAGETGATDVFVLRRIAPDRLFNVDGHGRGAGWAGNVTVDPDDEPLLSQVIAGDVVKRASGVPFRVFGPYWSGAVAAVPVGQGVVIFGGGPVQDLSDDILRATAERAVGVATSTVPVEKIEADEAELSQALDDLQSVDPGSLDEAARHVASLAARALSCEFAAVLLSDPFRLFLADEGWRPAATEEEIMAALLPLRQAVADGILVEQDLSVSNYPYRPLSFEDGLVARCVVPLGEGARLGLLACAHAGSAARGFTSLCQRVASSIGVAAGELLEGQINEG